MSQYSQDALESAVATPSTVETNNMMTNASGTLLRGQTLPFSALSAAEVASRVRASAPPPLRF